MIRIAELASKTDAPVKRQHLVSQVLLAQFATPIRRTAGLHVQPHDLRNPQRSLKPRTPRDVCWIEDFVPYASASIEQVWKQVEQHLPEAFASVAAGTALDDPDTVALLRDVIALHWVRSQHYRDLYKAVFRTFYQERLRRFLNEDQVLLQLAVWERTGLLVTGPEGLTMHAERVLEPMASAYESGALFRVLIEAVFAKARSLLAGHAVQILQPGQGEFLIGDNPALTERRDGPRLSYKGAAPLKGRADPAVRPASCLFLSGEPQVDPGDGVSGQQVSLGLDEAVLQRKPQSVLVRGQDDGLDHFGPQFPSPIEPACIEFLAEAVSAVSGEHAGDNCGRECFVRRRAHGAAAHEIVIEIRDFQVVALGTLPYLVQGEVVGRNDHVVDVLPVLEHGVIVRLLDAKIRHRTRRPGDIVDVNSVRCADTSGQLLIKL